MTVKSDEKEVALYSISSHPLDTNEFCVCGRDYMVRTYDKRMAEKPLKIYHPFKVELLIYLVSTISNV